MIDLRSDTVTKPTPEMLEAMMRAEVGDDVFGDDPTTIELENIGASMFAQEAGLFCASGTMSNQIAIKAHTQPGEEVICHRDAHIYRYEGGGMAGNAGVSVRLLNGDYGKINPEDILDEINPDDIHYPITSMVSIEDTANRGGGHFYDYRDIKRISRICADHNLKFHLDGARVFNALEESMLSSVEYGKYFDSISICMSKGLGAPAGTLLLGSRDFIKKARRIRKAFGGGMRQTGYYAAAGIYALKNNILRLCEDHIRAKSLEKLLGKMEWIESVIPVKTNIVIALLQKGIDEQKVVEKLKQSSILCVAFGKGRIRMVTHLGISDVAIKRIAEKIPDVIG